MSESFDYIVVGAGSAGCVVAARLSESGRHSVLLLEAGGEDNKFWIQVPMGYAKVYADPSVNWMDESEPESALEGRTIYVPHGKVLGGTSSINGLLYMRGHRADYDGWRQRGCAGWDWESVLPYFKKSEDQERGPNDAHGVGGPLRVANSPYRFEIGDRWIEAAMEAGLPPRDDFNDGEQDGVGRFQSTTLSRRRLNTAKAFLHPVRHRPNLTVATHARATRILIENGRATGVAYIKNGMPQEARARGEVIVSGGVFNSPHLLQVSGLGPAGLLRDLGIPVVRDIEAVGANLQDHLCVRAQFRCTKPITVNDLANSFWRRMAAGLQYVLFRRGILSTNGNAAGGFMRSDPRLERPDLQMALHAWSFAGRNRQGAISHPFPGFCMNTTLLHPDARGTVRPRSADPLSPPSIRFNFMQSDHDLRALTAGLRIARKIAQQPALRAYIHGEVTPGPAVKTDAEIADNLRQNAGSNMHAVGTCRMGPNDDDVLDPRLRVRGVSSLRVIDASIMPTITSGGTNAPTIMIAEKGADMILEDARA
jgi:choline dehydrogenase